MTNDEEIRRAQDAERVMNEPLLVEAFDRIERGIVDNMKTCPIADRQAQHEMVLMLQLLGGLRKHFAEVMTTGKLARLQRESAQERLMRDIAARQR